MNDHVIGFFSENGAYGCFSNWYPSEFTADGSPLQMQNST